MLRVILTDDNKIAVTEGVSDTPALSGELALDNQTTLTTKRRRPPTRHHALPGAISNLEPPTGIEPVTYALRERRSAY